MGILTTQEPQASQRDGGDSSIGAPGLSELAGNGIETRAGEFEHNEWMLRNGVNPSTAHPGAAFAAATMANDLLTQPDTESQAAAFAEDHSFDGLTGKAFEEPPIWKELYTNLCDFFFPPKLPPLELTSTPIPVPDRMAVKPNPWAIGIAAAVNLLILAAVLYFGARVIIQQFTKPPEAATNIDVGVFKFKGPKGNAAGGGGGGGDHSIIDPIKGKLPKREARSHHPSPGGEDR
jgi:hypothetical protein